MTTKTQADFDWQTYVDSMKGKNTEEYLAGDIEGYRRGWSDGFKNGKQETADLTLAGLILIVIATSAFGVYLGSML